MEVLFQLFTAIEALKPALKKYILSALERKEFKKGEFILKEDQVARYIYFIEKGIVRSFRYHNDKEETLWFMKEYDLVVSVESFFPQLPATEFIQAIEYTVLHRISFDQLNEAYRRFSQFNLHGRVILQKYYIQSLQRESMRRKRAFEKYEYLMKNHKELVGRVQDKYLASYLGVTPETFSYQKRKYAKGKTSKGKTSKGKTSKEKVKINKPKRKR